MPTGMETVIGGLLAQQGMGMRAQELQEAIAARQAQMEESMRWRAFLQSQSPAWGRLALAQQKQSQADKAAAAGVNFVLNLDPNKVDPQWRPWLNQVQSGIRADPVNGTELAKRFINSYRPQGLQYKTVEQIQYDQDGNPIGTETSIIAIDPGSISARSVGGPSGGGGGGGGGGSAPTAPDPTASIRAKYKNLFPGTGP